MDPMNTPDSEPASAAPRTPGQRLRAAREARGLHLAMLSVTLKVPVRQLEALENDQYDAFRGPAFVRAVPGLQEVSIGHALMADALELGYAATVRAYLDCLQP